MFLTRKEEGENAAKDKLKKKKKLKKTKDKTKKKVNSFLFFFCEL